MGMHLKILFALIFITDVSYSQEKNIADSLIQTVLNIENDTTRIQKLIDYANIAGRSSLKLTEILSKEIMEQSIKANYLKGVSDAYNLYGIIYSAQGKNDKAEMNYQKALNIYQKINYTYGVVNIYNNLGLVNSFRGLYTDAMDYYLKALKILEDYKNEKLLSLIYSNLGKLFIELNDKKKAYQYLKKSEKICSALKNYNNLVYVYCMLGKTGICDSNETALQYHQKSLKLGKTINNKIMVGISYREIGDIHFKNMQYAQALFYYKQALKTAKELKHTSSIIRALISIGYYFYYQKSYKEAIAYNLEALELSKKNKFKEGEKNTALHLSYIYNELGNYKKAYNYRILFEEISYSMYSNNTFYSITKLFNKLEKERSSYEYKLNLHKKEIRSLIFVLIIILCLIIFTCLYIVQRKKTNSAIKKQEFLNRELTSKTIFLVRKNEIFNKIETILNKNKKRFIEENQKTIEQIINEIKQAQDKKVWSEFNNYFNKVHPNFQKNLNARYPNLSNNEKRLCLLLRVNMKTKDISLVTQQTPHTIAIARSRLRKKLGISNQKISLYEFLARF